MKIEAEGDGDLGLTGQNFCCTVMRRCCHLRSPLLVWLVGTRDGRRSGSGEIVSGRADLDVDDVPARRLIWG
jgi:hypothetical protein